MRSVALLICFLAFPAFAYPVTYVFTGTVTYISPTADMYNSNTSVVGSFTYDSEITEPSNHPAEGLYWGQMLGYQIAAAGQSFHMLNYIPFSGFQSVTYRDSRFGFFDEVPGVSFDHVIPDYGHFELDFSGAPFADRMPTSDLPLNHFTGGNFGFGGGTPANGVESTIIGTIDTLFRVPPKKVPEPASLALFALGLCGIFVRRFRRVD